MFASSKISTIVFLSSTILSVYILNVNADVCSDVKDQSEVARISAENACSKAAEVAINSADSTKAVAKKACDDAKIIAKNVADKAAAAVCPEGIVEEEEQKMSTVSQTISQSISETTLPIQNNVPETSPTTPSSHRNLTDSEHKKVLHFIRTILVFLRLV